MSVLGMQRYHFFRSDPIQKILSIGQFRSDPSAGFFYLFFIEFLYFCVTLLCVKHNLLDNFILMKNNMKKIYRGCLHLVNPIAQTTLGGGLGRIPDETGHV